MPIDRETVRLKLFNALQQDLINEGGFTHLKGPNDLPDDASFLNIGADDLDILEAISGLEQRFNLEGLAIEPPSADTVGSVIDTALEAELREHGFEAKPAEAADKSHIPHPNSIADSESALTHGEAREAFYRRADKKGSHHLTYQDHLRLSERSPD